MSDPIDVRQNNPLNLEGGGPYIGQMGIAGGKLMFDSPMHGFRAAFRNYITFSTEHGIDTVRKLISRWSPAGGDNKTASDPDGTKQLDGYISAVCKSSGFEADETINLTLWHAASKLCYAQVVVESGESFEKYWHMSEMAEGAFRAGIIGAPQPWLEKQKSKVAGAASTVMAASAGINEVLAPAQQVSTSLGMPHVLTSGLFVSALVFGVLSAVWHVKSHLAPAQAPQ